jgi:hypothetical protein
LKSPADQKIVQIDITNACTHRCSNCTRFCGHHRKPFFMEFKTFEQAVASLQDHPGMVGIMGGEPTLHLQFERFVEHLRHQIGPPEPVAPARLPLTDFVEHTEENLAFEAGKKRGLWTSLGEKYYEHFELIQDTFPYQCINDHTNPGLHQALLVARKDLNIPDSEWIPMRDRCWIQNLWSSAITPKGAFFCEVAAALDMLFDGPGGWPVEPGWWQRTPDQFGAQLDWCELCGAALQTPRGRANEETDTASPTLMEKLKAIHSPKVARDRVQLWNATEYRPDAEASRPSNEWYLPDEDNTQRVDDTNRSLYPRAMDAIVLGRMSLAFDALVREAVGQFDRVVAVVPGPAMNAECLHGASVCRVAEHDASRPAPDNLRGTAFQSDPTDKMSVPYNELQGGKGPSSPGAVLRKRMLDAGLAALQPKDWVVALDADAALDPAFASRLRGWILNPGCLYEFKRNGFGQAQGAMPTGLRFGDEPDDLRGPAFCSVFNIRARALRGRDRARLAFDAWPPDKRIDMLAFLARPDPLAERRRQGEDMARQASAVWQALTDAGLRIALLGAGHHTRWLLNLLKAHKLFLPCVLLDDNAYAAPIAGMTPVQPETADPKAFDAVVVSADPGPITRLLIERARTLWDGTKPAIELYPGRPDGRFMKIVPEPPRDSDSPGM